MDFKHFKAGKDDEGRRLDKIIRKFLNENALSSIYKSLRKGLIKVNGKKCDGDFRISENDDISIAEFLVLNTNENSKKQKVQQIDEKFIIFRNEDILFLNKPYDIPVQPAKEFKGKSLSEIVEEDYEFFHQKKESISFKTGPLHRLDRKTTGIIAFSQSLSGAKIFSELMQNHKLQKTYLGIMEGILQKKEIWVENIEKEADTKEKFHTVKVSDIDTKNGKLSHTEAEPIAFGKYKNKDVTFAKFIIKTGRTHQIRAQSAKNGHPLLGDTAYGSKKIENCNRDFFLHAYKLEFMESNELLNIPKIVKAKIDSDFENILEKIGIKDITNLIN